MSEALRLLLVDDEATARARLRDLLGDISAEVPSIVMAEAADGFAALERAQAGDLDVALIDIRMPGMDGVELGRHLARLPSTPAAVSNCTVTTSSVLTSRPPRRGSTVDVRADSCAMRSPVTNSIRSHQCEPMSPNARESPPRAGSTRQFSSPPEASQSCR